MLLKFTYPYEYSIVRASIGNISNPYHSFALYRTIPKYRYSLVQNIQYSVYVPVLVQVCTIETSIFGM
jgi:hypothetical protein